MTHEQRFERQLPDLLEALYLGPTPDYRNDVLARVARTRQRPAWSFPGRWFPMLELIQPQAPTRRTPWRLILVAVLVLLLIAASVAVYIGSRPPLPAPFGPAANGLLAWSDGGTIYTADPRTGAPTTIVAGPGTVYDPFFSSDGTLLAFERVPAGTSDANGGGLMFVVHADGSGLVPVDPQPLTDVKWYDISADDRYVVISSTVAGKAAVSVARTDGSSFTTLDLGRMTPGLASFRPGTTDIMFSGTNPLSVPGIYLIGVDGTNLHPLVTQKVGESYFGDPVWSPDGSRLAYVVVGYSPANSNATHIHIWSADGSDRPLFGANAPANQFFDAWPSWSPDGTKLLVQRVVDGTGKYSVVAADGSGKIVDIQATTGNNGANYQWSPDGSSILARPNDAPQQWQLWNPDTGTVTTAPVTASSWPSWQRAAP